MNSLHSLIGQQVELLISGKKLPINGKLIDQGGDLLVVRTVEKFLYIPLLHLQQLTLSKDLEEEPMTESEPPFETQSDISYRKTLMNAKGIFSEIYITGNQSLHGYVTSIMNDFFVFYSPVFHSVYIPLQHLKYMVPYSPNVTPYSLTQEKFPLTPAAITLARTFDQQVKKLEGQFVVFDLGEHPNKIGQLKSLQNHLIELVAAEGDTVFLHLEHVKTVHLP
jgi:hypothetical protein